MTTAATLLSLIAHAQHHVTALESLVAGMTRGLRGGLVDSEHMYTLMTTQTRAINAQLDEVASGVEKIGMQAAAETNQTPPLTERGDDPPIYMTPMGGYVGRR